MVLEDKRHEGDAPPVGASKAYKPAHYFGFSALSCFFCCYWEVYLSRGVPGEGGGGGEVNCVFWLQRLSCFFSEELSLCVASLPHTLPTFDVRAHASRSTSNGRTHRPCAEGFFFYERCRRYKREKFLVRGRPRSPLVFLFFFVIV